MGILLILRTRHVKQLLFTNRFPIIFIVWYANIKNKKVERIYVCSICLSFLYIFNNPKYLMLSSWWLYNGRKDSKKFIGHRNDKTLVLCLPPTVCGRVCKWVMLLVNYHVPSWMWPGDILPWNFWNVVNCNNMHTSIPSMENLFSYLKQ